MKDDELKNQALRRMAMAKAMPEGGRGMPTSQVQRRIDVPAGGFSPDYQKSKYAQRNAGLTQDRAPVFTAPGFTGKAKKARIHSQRVQFDRARRAEAADLAKVDAQGLNLMRAQAGRQAFEAQQEGLRRRQNVADQTSARKNLLADRKVARQQALQDQGRGRGLSPENIIKADAALSKGYGEFLMMNPEFDKKGNPNPNFRTRDQYGAQFMPHIQQLFSGAIGRQGAAGSQEDSQALYGGGSGTITQADGTVTSLKDGEINTRYGLGNKRYLEDAEFVGGSATDPVYDANQGLTGAEGWQPSVRKGLGQAIYEDLLTSRKGQ